MLLKALGVLNYRPEFYHAHLIYMLNEQYNEQVSLCWNTDSELNIFELLIKDGLDTDARNKIIFYTLINYKLCVKDGNEKYFIRVIRNLLQATRQRNDTKFNTNIRINEFGNYHKLFTQLLVNNIFESLPIIEINNKDTKISDDALINEKNKAVLYEEGYGSSILKLEEFKYLGGLLHSLDINSNKDNLDLYASAVREIWSNMDISDSLIIRALVASGFDGIEIKMGSMGIMKYFGNNDNWTTVLTHIPKHKNYLIVLLNKYITYHDKTPKEKLDLIINEWKDKNSDDRSWKYYFMKYDSFFERYNYFAWTNDYEIRVLGSDGKNPLLAYHTSPYTLAVCSEINDESICLRNNCYQQYSGNSPLNLKLGVSLTCTINGWSIDCKDKLLPEEILNEFQINTEGEKLLQEFNNRDRVEIAVDFCKKLALKYI